MNAIYGIDLGTTFTKCALIEGDDVRVFNLDVEVSDAVKGNPSLPGLRSVVTVALANSRKVAYVGNRALLARKRLEPKCASFEETKLWIGTNLDHAPSWLFSEHEWEYRPEDVGALVLRAVAKEVERAGAPAMSRIVVTHPAQFDSLQQQATRQAAGIAGIAVMDLLTEPEAAAIAYSRQIKEDGKYLIFDLGGGTLDLVLLEIRDRQFGTLRKSGVKIGGRDFDRIIVDTMIDRFKIQTSDVFSQDMLGVTGEELWLAEAERIKRRLNGQGIDPSEVFEFEVPFDARYAFETNLSREMLPHCLLFQVCRAELEEKMDPLLQQCRELVERTLADGRVGWGDVKGVISVGGSTKMLAIQALLDQMSDGKVLRSLDPDTVVAQGAAIHAASFAQNSTQAVVPEDLIKKTPYRGTLSRSLGLKVETSDGKGRIVTLVEKGTPTPLEKPFVKQFSTSTPGQDHILIELYEGESPDPEDLENNLIGECRIEGFKASDQLQRVTVSIQIEGNDTKRIAATIDGQTYNQPIKFDPSRVLAHAEVERRRRFVSSLSIAP